MCCSGDQLRAIDKVLLYANSQLSRCCSEEEKQDLMKPHVYASQLANMTKIEEAAIFNMAFCANIVT